MIRRMLEKRLGARADLDDLVQSVFLEFLRALPRFRGESMLSTFAGGVAIRVAYRAMRPTSWDRLAISIDSDPEDAGADLERRLIAREQVRRLSRALAKLSQKKRRAFLSWAIDGKTPAEISRLTRTSPSAVRSQIFYARKSLVDRARRDPYLADLVV